jgi:hypothetical protein
MENKRNEKRIGFYVSTTRNKFGEIKDFKRVGETDKALRFSYLTTIKGKEQEISFWVPKKAVYNQTEKTLGIARIWVASAIENDLIVGHFILSNQKEAKQ